MYISACVAPEKVAELDGVVGKIVDAGGHFAFRNGKLVMDISKDELKKEYRFTEADYTFLEEKVLNPKVAQSAQSDSNVKAYGARCAGGVYMSYADLTAGFAAALFAASSVSPAALAAAFTAMSGAFTGPIGAIVAGGVAVLGIGFFADLAMKIVGAVAQGKGVCLQMTWSFPPLQPTIM